MNNFIKKSENKKFFKIKIFRTLIIKEFFAKQIYKKVMPEEKIYYSRKRPRKVGIIGHVHEKKVRMVLTKEEKTRLTNYAYSFTLNNYTDVSADEIENMYEENRHVFRYLVYGKEVGEQGTAHFQGHVDLLKGMTISALQKLFQKYLSKNATILDIKISAEKSRDYAIKDGDFVEYGTRPMQGRRNDLVTCMEFIRENSTLSTLELVEMFPSCYSRHQNFLDKYKMMVTHLQTLDWTYPPNIFVWGPPGVGKSRYFQSMPSLYRKDCNKWFCGYNNEDNVLIEDVDPVSCRMLGRYIKLWADRYPINVQVKNSAMTIRPKRIFITSNYPPWEVFTQTDLPAIERRFVIIEQTGPRICDIYLVRKFVKIVLVSRIYITLLTLL